MANLVTTIEAAANVDGFSALDAGVQSSLVSGASTAIQNACDRVLASTSLVEFHEPGRTRTIHLKQFPVSDVSRVAAGAQPVVTIQCTDTACSRASFRLTGTGDPPWVSPTTLILSSTKNGVTTTTSLTLASYATIGLLATAINAVSGWTTVIAPTFSTWAVADLTLDIGSRDALLGPGSLWAFVRDVADFDVQPMTGRLTLSGGWPLSLTSGFGTDVFRFPDQTWGSDKRFGQVRVNYIAGYLVVPEDLKRATYTIIQLTSERIGQSGLIVSEKEGPDQEVYAGISISLMSAVSSTIAIYIRQGFA